MRKFNNLFYYYNTIGKKTVAIEGNRTVIFDFNENILIEVQADVANTSQITIGRGSAKIYINEDDGAIHITGKIIVNGTLISPI